MVRNQIAEYFKQKRRIPQVKMVNWQPQLVRKLDDRRSHRFNPVSGSESHVLRLSLKSMNDQDSISLIFYIFFISSVPVDLRMFGFSRRRNSLQLPRIAKADRGERCPHFRGSLFGGVSVGGGWVWITSHLLQNHGLNQTTIVLKWFGCPGNDPGGEEIEAPRMCDAWHPTSPNSFGEEQ